MTTSTGQDADNVAEKVGGLAQWLDERLNLQGALKFAEKKQVPMHKYSVWYYMGGIALMLMVIQFASGVLLMVYYIPGLEAAHASILRLNSQVDFGWFFRSIHSWGANLLIAVLGVHLFSAYFMKAYRKPREFTWYSGLVLMIIALGFGFTGYLLPWDDVSFFATKIGLDIASKMPFVGDQVAVLLRGGHSIGQATLSRFFVIHVALLPLLTIGLMGLHLLFVQLHGMSEPAYFQKLEAAKRTYEKFFPNFLLKDLLVWLLAFNGLAALVTLMPWGLGPEADPFGAAPLGIKPEWYFLAPFQFLKIVPAQIGPIEGELMGALLMILFCSGLVIVPFFDKGDSAEKAKTATYYGLVLLLAIVVFTVWGALS
ncbi:MAG: cytochrome b N-terminal domain-containing protein [Cyanobacteria bacterium REEB67]|nr:cytochrome b N-terminal domain-containing protein [Cyanobacteria bacterium REEB67]